MQSSNLRDISIEELAGEFTRHDFELIEKHQSGAKDPIVSIIEDDFQVAEGLKHSINFQADYQVVSVYHSAEEAEDKIADDDPDIIFLDVYLPKMNGVDFIPILKKKSPKSAIIMLTSSDEDVHVFNSLKAGALGYLIKNSSISQIIEAMELVLKGGAPLSDQITRKVVTSFQREVKSYNFTEREQEILNLLSEGKGRKQIAEALFIEVNTVKFHLNSLYKKMGVNSQSEAIAKAHKEGLI